MVRTLLRLLLTIIFALGGSATCQIQFHTVPREVVQKRLNSYEGEDIQRENTLKEMFQKSGCDKSELSEQAVKGLKEPNLICILPGTQDKIIVIGAHFDHVKEGHGVVDNWSGASLLPSLFESIKAQPRKHTFVFIAFAGEEQGLVGSKFYVKSLTTEQKERIESMICMDTLGLGPTEVWTSHSDKKLVVALNGLAHVLSLPLTGVNVEQVGESDEESFKDRKIPTITIHSLTQKTLPILHSSSDKISAIKFDDYYDTYRLLSAYLSYLDELLAPPSSSPH